MILHPTGSKARKNIRETNSIAERNKKKKRKKRLGRTWKCVKKGGNVREEWRSACLGEEEKKAMGIVEIKMLAATFQSICGRRKPSLLLP